MDALLAYLGRNQVNVCWKRIKVLQEAVRKTKFKYDDWKEEAVAEELSGMYGRTFYAVL